MVQVLRVVREQVHRLPAQPPGAEVQAVDGGQVGGLMVHGGGSLPGTP